jgi:demethylmacrocin O-methyltransferase
MGLTSALKNTLKKRLSPEKWAYLKWLLSYDNPAVRKISAVIHSNDLNKLATIHKTDKWNLHWYTQHYQHHFNHLKNEKINLLEIGVGGDEDPMKGGNSVRMWKSFFSRANIFAIDLHDKSRHEESRIKIFRGDQSDTVFLNSVADHIKDIDIIIDDGSHINEHVIISFKTLFPRLKKGGIYVIEDTQTSYWDNFGGDSKNLQNPTTMMNFFKSLVDCLNHKEFRMPGYQPSYYDQNITAMHFYRNLVIIYK